MRLDNLFALTGLFRLAAGGLLAIALIDHLDWGDVEDLLRGYRYYGLLEHRADLPAGFFTLLQITVTGATAMMAASVWRLCGGPNLVVAVNIAIAIVFQPFVEVSFEYETWFWLDILVLGWVGVEYLIGRNLSNQISHDAGKD